MSVVTDRDPSAKLTEWMMACGVFLCLIALSTTCCFVSSIPEIWTAHTSPEPEYPKDVPKAAPLLTNDAFVIGHEAEGKAGDTAGDGQHVYLMPYGETIDSSLAGLPSGASFWSGSNPAFTVNEPYSQTVPATTHEYSMRSSNYPVATVKSNEA